MPDYDTWRVVNTVPHPHTLGQWNSVCTISNGYLGLKGNLAEQRDGYSPVTLINGVFDELEMFGQLRASGQERPYLDPRYFDTAGKSPAIANLPNPLFVQAFVGELEISHGRGEISNFAQSLDLATGLYRYSYDYRDGSGRTTRVEMERFACLKHAHRVFMRYSLTPLDHEAPVRVHSGISGEVRSNITGERQFQVTERWTGLAERCRLIAHTPARGHVVRMGVVNRLTPPPPGSPLKKGTGSEPIPLGNGENAFPQGACTLFQRAASGRPGGGLSEAAPDLTLPQPLPGRERGETLIAGVAEHDAVYTRYEFPRPATGQTVTLERCIVLTCSEDLRHGLIADLEHELDAATAQGFDAALAEQRAAWAELWQRCDVQIEGDDPAQLGLRFCIFHLLQAAPRFTDRLSVPVKLLTGEYYQGCTFYDTDLYIVPFYTFTRPELARTCLNFRFEGLRPGREIARQLGYEGAKLAWQAGPSGEECLGCWWRFTHTNIHINADAAYAVVQYCRATGDERFLAERGIDLLVETARFVAARVVYDAKREQYDLPDVTGPDDGHCAVTNDFHTNKMAVRNLRAAADMLDHLARIDQHAHAAALRRLGLRPGEAEKWRQVADRLTLLFDPQTRLCEQFTGFFELPDAPSELLELRKTRPVSVAPYQLLNQPDVVMALVLLRDEFPLDVRRINWDYYKDKSLNLSSMSFAVNAIMAADIGDLADAYKHFIITTGMDLDEALTGRKDTYAGLHGTAAAGAWLAAVFGFGGVHLTERGLTINPNLPPLWSALRFNLVLQGVLVNVAIDRQQVVLKVGTERKAEIPAAVARREMTLKSGEMYTVQYRQ